MALTLFPVIQPLDDDGAIVPGGKLQFYATGTLDEKAVYHDADGLNPWAQPVELDGAGRAFIFMANDGAYDIVYTDADDATIWTLTKFMPYAPVVT